jgi:hypothetical protein
MLHSLPHSSQISAQKLQTLLANSSPLDINDAANLHASAQYISNSMQRAISLTFSSCKHAIAQ